jgi:malate permease and related proteins
MGISQILNSLVMIFIMIIPGIILKKKNIINESQTKGISAVLVNVTWPCMVIDAMQIPYTVEIFNGSKYIFFLLVIIFLIIFIVAATVVKALKLKRAQAGILAFMLIFGNTGFIGLPVMNALYGKEAVFYASMVEMANDILMFTIGIMLIQISAGAKTKFNLKEFFSPGIFGVLIGFALFLSSITLPEFLGKSVSVIGAATTPLSMIVIGSQLGGIRFKELAGDINIYAASFVKLLVVPLIALAIVRFVFGDVSLLAKVVIMSFAMPAAACTVIFSQQYNSDADFAAKGVLVSTLFCLATIPVFAVLLG